MRKIDMEIAYALKGTFAALQQMNELLAQVVEATDFSEDQNKRLMETKKNLDRQMVELIVRLKALDKIFIGDFEG